MSSFEKTLLNRRSIRAYEDKPVSSEQIRNLLTLAGNAPSAGNTQPWEVIVAQGEPLTRIKDENERLFMSGEPLHAEVTNNYNVTNITEAWPPTLARRYQYRGRKILESQNIARNDKEARHQYYNQMYRYFEAPTVFFLGVHKQLPEGYALFDLGLFAQNLCLAAHAAGLATCIEAIGVFYPSVIRAHLPVPEHLRLAVSITLGYADMSAPINLFERDLAPLEEWVHGLA